MARANVAENPTLPSIPDFAPVAAVNGHGAQDQNARLETGANTVPPKFDSDSVIRYNPVQEGGVWRIDDVRSTTDGKPWSLRDLLKGYLKS
jgi:hypothetical protein